MRSTRAVSNILNLEFIPTRSSDYSPPGCKYESNATMKYHLFLFIDRQRFPIIPIYSARFLKKCTHTRFHHLTQRITRTTNQSVEQLASSLGLEICFWGQILQILLDHVVYQELVKMSLVLLRWANVTHSTNTRIYIYI